MATMRAKRPQKAEPAFDVKIFAAILAMGKHRSQAQSMMLCLAGLGVLLILQSIRQQQSGHGCEPLCLGSIISLDHAVY